MVRTVCVKCGRVMSLQAVARTCAESFKPCLIEASGNDPFIVMPSADIERAATVAVTARNQNNGQSCIAGKRFIVHADVYDEFTELFARKTAALKLGDPFEESTDIGPLATEGR